MSSLRLGVIGLSEGNGHPYSWAAIFNGYDPVAMEDCGFPVIPRYLEKQKFPQDAIAEATVTHVWTQDRALSKKVAAASLIEHVADHYTDMIGKVDGILLARDDARNHYRLAKPFLDAGLPIYIDKPIALSVRETKKIYKEQQFPGQIFTCSALRYAKELALPEAERSNIGSLHRIYATSPKDWDKYAVHVIEPLLLIAGLHDPIVEYQRSQIKDAVTLSALWGNGLQATIQTLGDISSPIFLEIVGSKSSRTLYFSDTYSAFRSALYEFVQGIIHRDVRIDSEDVLKVVSLIEAGRLK